MSSSYALQVAIVAALENSEAVGFLINDRIFDGKPSDAQYPCVTFSSSDVYPQSDAENCQQSDEVTLQIDCWSQDQGKLHPTRTLTDTVAAVLYRANLNLAAPYSLVEIKTSNRVFLDNDKLTGHGIVTVEAEIDIVDQS